MKIMVSGKEGQVARCLAERSVHYPALDLVFAARSGTDVILDLADSQTIKSAVHAIKPDIIINAAAYTAVDQAEDEPDFAMQVNGIAPGLLAVEADKIGAHLIQISTDYVFDGLLDRPYREEDPVNPVSVYGKTKLAGERAVQSATPRHTILRTAWVYSPYGKNFYKTMLRLAESRDEISVVDDQIGTPTSAFDIADGLLAMCEQWRRGKEIKRGEIYHLGGANEMSWCEFARKIMSESKAKGGPYAKVRTITTDEYPTKAVRPKNSRLVSDKFHAHFTLQVL